MFLPCPLQLYVDGDEAASATHTSTAVDQDRFVVIVGVRVTNPLQEVEQGGGVTGDAKIWPRGEMELTYLSHLFRVQLMGREVGVCIASRTG